MKKEDLNIEREKLGMGRIEDQGKSISKIQSFGTIKYYLTESQLIKLCNDLIKEKCRNVNFVSALWLKDWLKKNNIEVN